MPDNKKNDPKTSGAKKSGSSSLWIIGLVVIVAIALIAGLVMASYSRPAGALAFLILLSLGYFIVPGKWHRFYALALVSLAIAIVILTVAWELMGSNASESMDAPTIFAMVVVLLGLGVLVGMGIVAFAIVAGTSFILPWVTSVGGHADMDKGELRKFLIRSYLGLSPSYLVFAGDKIIAESPKGIMPQIGGPGLAIIKPETAVVFEHMGTVSRVSGPATLKDIKMFELPKAIIDLRPQWDTTGDFAVSTQDGEVVHLSVRYRSVIERTSPPKITDCYEEPPPTPEKEAEEGTDSFAPPPDAAAETEPLTGTPDIRTATIRSIAYGCGQKGWKEETRETVRSAVRSEILGCVLDELFPALLHAEVKHEDAFTRELQAAQGRAATITRTWGVIVDHFSIDRITPPTAVTEGTRVLRKGRIDAASTTVAGEAEARVFAGLQTMEAQAQETKLRILLHQVTTVANELSPEHVTAYFELVEKLANIINRNRVVDYRYVEALEALSENPNARIIIQPGNNGVFIENVMD